MTRGPIRMVVGAVVLLVAASACGTDKAAEPVAVERSSCDASRPTGKVATVQAPVAVKIPELPTWGVDSRNGQKPNEYEVSSIIYDNTAVVTVSVRDPVRPDDLNYSLRFAAGIDDEPRFRNEVRTRITVCGRPGFEVTGTQALPADARIGQSNSRVSRGREPLIKERTVVSAPVGGTSYIITFRSRVSDVVPDFNADLAAMLNNVEVPGA